MKSSTVLTLLGALLPRNPATLRVFPRGGNFLTFGSGVWRRTLTFTPIPHVGQTAKHQRAIPPKILQGAKWDEKEINQLIKYEGLKKFQKLAPKEKWDAIAEKLPGRSPDSCKKKFKEVQPVLGKLLSTAKKSSASSKTGTKRSILSRPVKTAAKGRSPVKKKPERPVGTGEWTDKEKERLMRMANFKKYQDMPSTEKWAEISERLPGRTPTACQTRFAQLNPERRVPIKRWSEEEYNKLEKLAKKYENNWEKVAAEIPDRTPAQCQTKYRSQHPSGKSSPGWSQEEITKLFESVRKHGNNWEETAKNLPGRSPSSCKSMFHKATERDALATAS
ncbi:6461_t:CDS:2 [Ambispora gerdemannii]|uniref:6461_t:CDS:1 n=1 Tax=Ambispora gerdemannii TaxID=144530 RepID=A0A9N9GGD8_9GLOM|nr:6461_t:CDS:2 [Ambispora gerdemannii]